MSAIVSMGRAVARLQALICTAYQKDGSHYIVLLGIRFLVSKFKSRSCLTIQSISF